MAALSPTALKLAQIFKKHGIQLDLTPEMLEQFSTFSKFLLDYNKRYNLTRLTSFDDVAVKHFVDCLYVVQMTDLPSPLLDLGTGAGFPGIPLKIASPQTRIVLAEGVQKKVEFLKQLREKLQLNTLDILGRNIDSKTRYPVQGVITRAVETAAATLANVSSCLQSGGFAILMKTPGIDQEIAEAKEKMSGLFELVRNEDYLIKNTSLERKLLIFQKKRL